MNKRRPFLTIIMPVYNEASTISQVIEDVYREAVVHIPGCELLITEDGSTDGTKEILRNLQKKIPLTLITGPRRKGYTKAFIDSIRMANSELVLFCDSDGQHDPGDISALLRHRDGYDIVGGHKTRRRDPWYRVVISKIYNGMLSLLFKTKLRDANSGFKLIRGHVIDTIAPTLSEKRRCVMSEFIIRSVVAGYKFKEIPVTHYPRNSGSSSVFKPSRLPMTAVKIFIDTLSIWRELSPIPKYRQ